MLTSVLVKTSNSLCLRDNTGLTRFEDLPLGTRSEAKKYGWTIKHSNCSQNCIGISFSEGLKPGKQDEKALGSFVLGHEKATAKLDCHCDCNWIARLVDMFGTASPRSSSPSSATLSPSHSSNDPGIMPYFSQPLVPVSWLPQSLSSEDDSVEESHASSCHSTASDNSGPTANVAVPVPVPAVSVSTWLLLIVALLLNVALQPCAADQDAKRLYEDLLSEYNRLIRPVGNNSDRLTVKLGLKLSQLIDVNLKNQIMTTNVWVEQEWFDYKLKWDPEEYGGVKTLHVPSENIWLPDIVLYNNADGNYEITIMTKAILRYDGTVTWKPPAIYKSSCELDMTHFPFDYQRCFMKFGSWTYDGSKVDLQHLHQMPNSKVVEVGIDLAEYYLSVEWDILEVPAQRNEKTYSCCEERYPDIFFNITLRRKTLFYTVNLIIPCVGISFLSVLVFYLPSESGEKMSLCVSILLSLTVFFLLLAEIIPPTSLTVPLLGKYLLFTMTMVTCSVIASTTVCSFHFRSPSTHRMAPWVRRVFIDFLPKVLFIQRPKRDDEDAAPGGDATGGSSGNGYGYGFRSDPEMHLPTRGTEISIIPVGVHDHLDYEIPPLPESKLKPAGSAISHSPSHKRTRHNESDEGAIGISVAPSSSTLLMTGGDAAEGGPGTTPASATSTIARRRHPPEMDHVIEDVRFIGQHLKNNQSFEGIIEDWKFVAMVLDRLFLWIFTIASVAGTAAILLEAPSLYDTTQPIDLKYSKIAQAKLQKLGLLGQDLGLL